VVSFGWSPLLTPVLALAALLPAAVLFAKIKPGEASLTGQSIARQAVSEEGAVS